MSPPPPQEILYPRLLYCGVAGAELARRQQGGGVDTRGGGGVNGGVEWTVQLKLNRKKRKNWI